MDIHIIKPNQIKDKKILSIGAHPDDVEYGSGGTLVQLSQQNSVSILIATRGQMGTHDLDADKSEVTRVRQAEARVSAKKLGAEQIFFWSYPDLRLRDWRPHLFKKILKLFLQLRPDIIMTYDPWAPYEVGIHPDHNLLSQVILEAVLCGTLPLFLQRKGYDRKQPLSPKPQVWLTCPAQVSHAVDITSVLDKKLSALESFVSQYDREITWQKRADLVKKLATDTASLLDNKKITFAEGFRVIDNNY